MLNPCEICQGLSVALRKESVDRNVGCLVLHGLQGLVALRKESVDRNTPAASRRKTTDVALRKESVDRNNTMQIVIVIVNVALRKESVDRNITRGQLPTPEPSLSARRAWIEMQCSDWFACFSSCRSPQGERG